MNEKEIVYFVMSHTIESVNGQRKFMFPELPHPDMGEEFIQKIKNSLKRCQNG